MLAYPGAQEAAVLGLHDLLATAIAQRPGDATPAHVAVLRPDALPAYETPLTALILPPSLTGGPPLPLEAPVAHWLLERHQEGATLCSVCVGAFLLAELGLLDGRPATTHWALAAPFRARFPAVRLDVDRMVIDDGDIVTAGGVMAWVDLGLALAARWLGREAATATARVLLVDPGGREQSFYRMFSPILTHRDAPILDVQRWMQARFAKPVSVEEMAAHAGLSRRTFLRRFRKATGLTTSAYLQELRVQRARELLEGTGLEPQEVAWRVGYEDAGSLRRVFVEKVGITPREYRRRRSVQR